MRAKPLLAAILVLSMPVARAFEIKPVCPSLRGALCSAANTDKIEFRPPSEECEKEKEYALSGRNQPIHEALTRMAYSEVTGAPLPYRNYLHPLLSGVEWNDDPEQDLRKVLLADGAKHILAFVEKLQSQKPEFSIAIRGHYGDMQFIHSMRPAGLESSPPGAIKQIIYEWLRNAYKVANGELTHDAPLAGTYFAKYFHPQRGYKVVSDIFDRRRLLVSDRYPATVRGLAAGSILHVIQDSYSSSHTRRDEKTGELLDFFKYPNPGHCQGDAGHTTNKTAIELALRDSTEFLKLWRGKSPWCGGGPDALVRRVFSISLSDVPNC